MRILHIACIKDDPFNGVSIAVPQHVNSQAKYAEVAFVNIAGEAIRSVDCQIPFNPKSISAEAILEKFPEPDLVVFHEAYRPAYLNISKDLRKRNIPYIIIPHGELSLNAQKKKWLKKKVANLLLFNAFIKNAVAVQCLSDREEQETEFGRKRFVGTNGVMMPPERKTAFREAGQGRRFVYIGRLDAYHKGLDVMVDAFACVAETMREYGCTVDVFGPDILGRGDALRSMISEASISDFMKLHPGISGADKLRTILDADIFIQTSRFEGMPLGVLEALSYGLPCLVTEGTNMGGFVFGHNAGWNAKVEADSVGKLIEEAIHCPDLISISNNARNAVETAYGWDSVSAGTIMMYESFVGIR